MPDARHADEILDEVRRHRAELVTACGGSLDSLFAALKSHERTETRRLEKLPPRRFDSSSPDAHH